MNIHQFNAFSMKLILAFPALGLLFCGALLPKSPITSPTAFPLPAPTPISAKMWVEKSPLYQGETLELRFQAPNAPYLGVIDPAGHFFYIVFPAELSAGKLKPLVESRQFERLSTLSISLADFKADPYTYGVYENQRVFTQSGTYTFILGANLHVDDPMLVEKVAVKYVHKPRPVSTTAEVAASTPRRSTPVLP